MVHANAKLIMITIYSLSKERHHREVFCHRQIECPGSNEVPEILQTFAKFSHFEYPKNPEQPKDLSAPINPDRDARKVGVFPAEETTFYQ